MGVIAQEVLGVIPEVVYHDPETDGYSVAYGGMLGAVIEAVKDLAGEVERLSAKLEAAGIAG